MTIRQFAEDNLRGPGGLTQLQARDLIVAAVVDRRAGISTAFDCRLRGIPWHGQVEYYTAQVLRDIHDSLVRLNGERLA